MEAKIVRKSGSPQVRKNKWSDLADFRTYADFRTSKSRHRVICIFACKCLSLRLNIFFMAKASDIKNGNVLRFNGELVQVEEFLHRTPGNLRAFYQARMRNVKSGKLVEYRFRTDEEVDIARVETSDYQYLYEDGKDLVVMDNTSYEQHNVPKALFGTAVKFLKEGMNVIVAFESEEPIMGSIPNSAELVITYTEPAVAGNTSSGALKNATVETGAEIKVPLFINIGDKVKVDTTTGSYVERVKG